MIWIAALALSYVFVRLGMLLVLVNFLTFGIKLAVLIISGLLVVLLWRKSLFRNLFVRKVPAIQEKLT